jgi:DNA-binding PadR family transcriptional regulator
MGHIELQILLVVAREPCHGYEMMKRIAQVTDGSIDPGPGTLYVALRRLVDSGDIRALNQPPQSRARRCYGITDSGRASLRREIDRLARVLRQAEHTGWRNRPLEDA